jgi:hypothetical protein
MEGSKPYRILIAVKASVIETPICIADTQCKRWIIRYFSSASFRLPLEKELTIRSKIINTIQIIGPEIHTAERCSGWHSKSCRSTTCQGSVQVRCYSQSARESIVETGYSDRSPYYVYCVVGLLGWVGGLADEVGWSLTCDVHLEVGQLGVDRKRGEESLLVRCSFRKLLGLCRFLRFLSGQVSVSSTRSNLTSVVG